MRFEEIREVGAVPFVDMEWIGGLPVDERRGRVLRGGRTQKLAAGVQSHSARFDEQLRPLGVLDVFEGNDEIKSLGPGRGCWRRSVSQAKRNLGRHCSTRYRQA